MSLTSFRRLRASVTTAQMRGPSLTRTFSHRGAFALSSADAAWFAVALLAGIAVRLWFLSL